MPRARSSSPPPEGDVDRQRYAREITSLLALPAFWSGQSPAFILQTLFEALEALLPIDACYGRVTVAAGDQVERLRVGQTTADPAETPWAAFVRLAGEPPMREATTHLEDFSSRPLSAVRLPIGYVGEVGAIVLGSHDPAFPSETDRALLQAAMGLLASSLEHARLLQQRDEAQRAKDEFLAMLGHELRNPLAPIVTALQLMALRAGGTRTREQEIIERQVQHLRALVDDLLDVSRITTGKIELHTERLDLADVVASAVETVSPLLEQKAHQLTLDVPRGLAVIGDPTRLTQVVSNLVANAAKYTLKGGQIRVTAGREGSTVTLRVADTGVGIPRQLLARIFDLFVQGRRGIGRTEGGLGIGLTVVKRLVELHGGSVAAHSDGPGRGSELSIILPAAPAALAAPSAAAPGPTTAAGPSIRVLVVDDNEDAAELALAVLADAGHHVALAHSGGEALRLVARFEPVVVVLDIGLPDIDGYAVAAQMSAMFDSPPVLIALTGYGQPRDFARSRQAGFRAHLVKPVDPHALLTTLAQAVEQRVQS